MTQAIAQAAPTAAAHKLSVVEKVGYSLGDLAANLIFQTLVTFLAFFYTDVYGISAGKAAMIMAAGGLFGAFFTPVMGIIADRTNTRWGKFRPWLLWTSVPFGALALLAFSTPDFEENGKVIYAFATYILLLVIYAANNLPYSALSGVLTGNMAERNSLSAYRFVAVMVAQFIIQVLLLPLVLILGDGDKAVGFHNTMLVFSITGTIFFLIAFITTKERILPVVEARNSIAQDLSDLFKNIPWIIMLLVTILVFVTLALKGGMYIFYFENYLSEAHLAQFLDDIGFNNFIAGLNALLTGMGLSEFQWPKDAPTSTFSLFNGCGIIMMIIGIGFSKNLADKFGKRNVFAAALFVSTLFVFAFNFYAAESIGIVFISQILHGFFYGITIPLLWAMIADVADYSEWKNNRRATAIIFSAMILGLKLGLTIGGSLGATLLAYYGYDAALDVQNAETIEGIKTAVSVFASLPFFIAVGCMFFYAINKTLESQIEADLNARRQAAGR
ncbi:transport protein [Cellvibrio sp. BR]|jgi:GPH family glycoside/pentoside/hexuronide:cation symporter|uniref:MFS transporter n=1 Tax=unclassified Cellvibrio TaxID=2624793 RepID=UPI0002600A97|nr:MULTISPECIES: MFS transporter [unclassified Cellvibrio]EIK44258.1 transport protein [Cellvibrio sp. BR]UUA72569.1 MFS transporter [Cellvibrio sp. QJXJ]